MIRFIDHNFKPDLIVSGFTPCSACVIVLRVRPSASLAPEIENRSSSEPRFLLQILPSDFSLVTTVPLEKILALPIWNRRAPPVRTLRPQKDPSELGSSFAASCRYSDFYKDGDGSMLMSEIVPVPDML
jgi:hypothetical protein